MLYIIGLGLNENGISQQGLEALKKCKKIYLENYTVNFPYSINELEKNIKIKVIPANREFVESDRLIKESKKEDIALLVYGSPLTATTHISLIQDAKNNKIKYEIIYSASIFDAIAETGLQIYKFGKITSMPKWKDNFKPVSFLEIIKENKKINAHSLILMDIDLEFDDAIKQLLDSGIEKKEKIIICSGLGTKNSRIFYKEIKDLKNIKIRKPYCIIIPGKMHFMEEEFLKGFI